MDHRARGSAAPRPAPLVGGRIGCVPSLGEELVHAGVAVVPGVGPGRSLRAAQYLRLEVAPGVVVRRPPSPLHQVRLLFRRHVPKQDPSKRAKGDRLDREGDPDLRQVGLEELDRRGVCRVPCVHHERQFGSLGNAGLGKQVLRFREVSLILEGPRCEPAAESRRRGPPPACRSPCRYPRSPRRRGRHSTSPAAPPGSRAVRRRSE